MIFDFNERFLSLDVVQAIDVRLRGLPRDGFPPVVSSDPDQRVILMGSRDSSGIVVFSRTGGSVGQRGRLNFEAVIVDFSVSTSGRLAVVLTGSGTLLNVVRNPYSEATLFVGFETSEDLRSVQATLAAQGYAIGAVDGIHGPRTHAAVKLFQRRTHLPDTGQVDERTFLALLDEEIRLTRELLKQRPEETRPVDWVGTRVRLGNALGTLGERQADTGLLEEAVDVYRAALEEAKRAELPAPLQSSLQNNLCFRLAQLGAVRSDRGLLEEAVADCRSALEMLGPEGAPEDLGLVFHSVGFALAKLGELTANTADLEKAIAAYRQAVEMLGAADAGADLAGAKQDLTQAEAVLMLHQSPGVPVKE